MAECNDKKLKFDCVFLDFKKAFDRVDHQALLNAFEGIADRPAVDWLRSFLSERKLSVRLEGQNSEESKGHLAPKPLVIGERYRFYQRDQRPGESIAAYLAELRSAGTRRKLLATDALTFDNAVKDALADELATRDALEVSATDTKNASGGVHKLRTPSRKPVPGARSTCFRCGGVGHKAPDCRYKDEVCNACGKKGHLQRVCRSKPAEQPGVRPTLRPRSFKRKGSAMTGHNYLFASDEDDQSSIRYVRVSKIQSSGKPPAPLTITAQVAGQELSMEVDTGAGVSVLPAATYVHLFSEHPLRPAKLVLQAYNGESLRSQGVLRLPVTINGQQAGAELYVVDCAGPALLGRTWLQQFRLNWTELAAIRNVKSSLQELQREFAAVFNDEQGLFKGAKAKLTLKSDATPKFVQARSVPMALKPKVEAEIRRMEAAGILTPVEWSEWATPVVPVLKPNGQVRLCGDFKVTVNPQLHIDQHPLPLIEEIFASLSGGQEFTKLDLKAAYTQMEVDDESKPLLTLNTHLGLFRLNRLPYGIASAPALWQRAMDSLLRDLPGVTCMIDDIIVTGRTPEEHLNTLMKVLQRLSDAGLKLNLAKCHFFQPKVEYCGHAISAQGLHAMP